MALWNLKAWQTGLKLVRPKLQMNQKLNFDLKKKIKYKISKFYWQKPWAYLNWRTIQRRLPFDKEMKDLLVLMDFRHRFCNTLNYLYSKLLSVKFYKNLRKLLFCLSCYEDSCGSEWLVRWVFSYFQHELSLDCWK